MNEFRAAAEGQTAEGYAPKLVRSESFVPTVVPKIMEGLPSKVDKGIYDSITLNLEDGIHPKQKDEGRQNTIEMLGKLTAGVKRGTQVVSRINGVDTPYFEPDAKGLILSDGVENLDAIMLPMVADVTHVERLVEIMETNPKADHVRVIALIETARGIENISSIAKGPRVVAIDFGIEDYTATLKWPLIVPSPRILSPAHERIINMGAYEHEYKAFNIAASAAGIVFRDGPYIAIRDKKGFLEVAEYGRQRGASAKWALGPVQNALAKDAFGVPEDELMFAIAVNNAMDVDGGTAKIEFGGTEIFLDPAVAKTVQPTLHRAAALAKQDDAFRQYKYDPLMAGKPALPYPDPDESVSKGKPEPAA